MPTVYLQDQEKLLRDPPDEADEIDDVPRSGSVDAGWSDFAPPPGEGAMKSGSASCR